MAAAVDVLTVADMLTVYADDAALVADLERRLGGWVMHHVVNAGSACGRSR